MTPWGSGDLGEAYCVVGGDICSDGGRWGSEGAGGAGSSSSESSGVYWGRRGGRLMFGGGESTGVGIVGDRAEGCVCMTPARAAAGPVGAATGEVGEVGVGNCSATISLSGSWGDIVSSGG